MAWKRGWEADSGGDWLSGLARRRLVLVTGKGGVGKSALAASLGVLLSARQRRVLVIELDPRESVHQMYGVPPSGGEIRQVRPGLFLQNLQSRPVLDRIVSRQVRIEWLAQRVRRSPVYDHFTEGAPGLKELAVLGHCLLLVEGRMEGAPRVDTVVLDAPATGHGVSLLAAPQLVADVIQHGPFGRMTGEVARFVGDPETTGVVVVTLAEEMPVTEALELRDSLLERLDLEPELLAVNGLYPPFTEDPAAVDDEAGRLWRDRRQVNEHEMGRLIETWRGARVELPFLPVDRGPLLIDALVERLGAAISEGGA